MNSYKLKNGIAYLSEDFLVLNEAAAYDSTDVIVLEHRSGKVPHVAMFAPKHAGEFTNEELETFCVLCAKKLPTFMNDINKYGLSHILDYQTGYGVFTVYDKKTAEFLKMLNTAYVARD